jgi:hypothetical protein
LHEVLLNIQKLYSKLFLYIKIKITWNLYNISP